MSHTFNGAAEFISIPPVLTLSQASWGCRIASVATLTSPTPRKRISLEVNLPPTAAVGEYSVTAKLFAHGTSREVNRHTVNQLAVILFNPWSTADTTYASTSAINWYLLRESGYVLKGEGYFG